MKFVARSFVQKSLTCTTFAVTGFQKGSQIKYPARENQNNLVSA
jgi:hypothetical protein